MNLKERDLKIGSLRSAVNAGGIDLENARDLLAWVIAEDAWRERIDMYTDVSYTFQRFDDFVTAKAPGGLGSTIADLERLVKGTPVELALQDARNPGRGRPPEKPSNSTNKITHGTTRAYALDRLKRDRPDLLARVLAGKMSAHAAALEAGFRKPMRSVPVDTPEAAVSSLLKVFSREQLRDALSD